MTNIYWILYTKDERILFAYILYFSVSLSREHFERYIIGWNDEKKKERLEKTVGIVETN